MEIDLCGFTNSAAGILSVEFDEVPFDAFFSFLSDSSSWLNEARITDMHKGMQREREKERQIWRGHIRHKGKVVYV